MIKFLLSLFTITIFIPEITYADSDHESETHYISDLEKYLTAPTRWDRENWAEFGLITGGIYITSEMLDDHWKDEMVNESHPYYYKGIDKIGDAWGDGRLSGTFLLGLYGYGHAFQKSFNWSAMSGVFRSKVRVNQIKLTTI